MGVQRDGVGPDVVGADREGGAREHRPRAEHGRGSPHLRVLRESQRKTMANDHHQAEALFKAWACALDQVTQIDPRRAGNIPSTKGVL
mgnify:CR=1 FL=1